MDQEIIRRQCMIKDHNGELVIMRCSFKECTQPLRWMCVKCRKLPIDHFNDCLDIDEFKESLKGNNEMYQFKQRQQLKTKILKELKRQKELILSLFQMIEQQYLESFARLELEEDTIQALYNRIQTQNPLTLTEEEFAAYQDKDNEKEASLFRQGQNQVCSDLMTFNSNIDNITLSLETLVGLKFETVIQVLGCKWNNSISAIGILRNQMKFGEWKIINKRGETIGGGQYSPDGSKHGQWIDVELANSFNSLEYVQHIGKYQNGKMIDQWKINLQYRRSYKDQLNDIFLGGGQYNIDGEKHGEWIDVELAYSYDHFMYLQHIGKYQNGMKIDQWQIKNGNRETIGGGKYNRDGMKHGEWIDVQLTNSGGFYVLHIGKYQNGKRIDQWEIKDDRERTIGGGQYNLDGSKCGEWIDHQITNSYTSFVYVQYIGKYQDGQRIGQWEIKDSEGITIGGGQYNPDGSKHEQWIDIELANSYYSRVYAQHIGKYQDGKRIDQWEIKDDRGRTIGGGQYNLEGSKHGQWEDIELTYSFGCFEYVNHIGQYNNGKRIDQWDIKYGVQCIGGGQYNPDGSKHGQWIDIEFYNFLDISGYYQHIGKYQNGKRIDLWEIKHSDRVIKQILSLIQQNCVILKWDN